MSERTATCPKCGEQVKRKDCYSGHGTGEDMIIEVFICECGKFFQYVWSDEDFDNDTGKPFIVEDKIIWG